MSIRAALYSNQFCPRSLQFVIRTITQIQVSRAIHLTSRIAECWLHAPAASAAGALPSAPAAEMLSARGTPDKESKQSSDSAENDIALRLFSLAGAVSWPHNESERTCSMEDTSPATWRSAAELDFDSRQLVVAMNSTISGMSVRLRVCLQARPGDTVGQVLLRAANVLGVWKASVGAPFRGMRRMDYGGRAGFGTTEELGVHGWALCGGMQPTAQLEVSRDSLVACVDRVRALQIQVDRLKRVRILAVNQRVSMLERPKMGSEEEVIAGTPKLDVDCSTACQRRLVAKNLFSTGELDVDGSVQRGGMQPTALAVSCRELRTRLEKTRDSLLNCVYRVRVLKAQVDQRKRESLPVADPRAPMLECSKMGSEKKKVSHVQKLDVGPLTDYQVCLMSRIETPSCNCISACICARSRRCLLCFMSFKTDYANNLAAC